MIVFGAFLRISNQWRTKSASLEEIINMIMNATDTEKYWRLAAYIRSQLPQAYYSKKIVKNMKTYGSLEKSQFGHALIWGTDPEIVITDLSTGFCEVQSAFGCFDKRTPNIIYLDEGLVKKFQNDPNDQRTRFFTDSGNSIPVLGATILHELCHWGNKRASQPEPQEMGEAFELATYGVTVGLAGTVDLGDEEAIHPD